MSGRGEGSRGAMDVCASGRIPGQLAMSDRKVVATDVGSGLWRKENGQMWQNQFM